MADNLIFPIKFDLEAAVREAQGDADRLMRRLQTTINAKPLAVNLKIPGAGSGSINEINSRLKELVKQWNSLTEAQRITNKTTGEYTAEAKKILAEYTRLRGASESYAQSLKQIDSAAKKAAKQQEKLAEAAYRGSNAFKNQDGYVSRLVKRLAVYASFQYTSQFLTNIREVTAQFELQRISLGAIIQDQQKANQIFAEIKSFALTSPLKILDLTKYAKQVAAYGFAADRVFDVTKRLADISVGLGVDMGRLTLAVSQIKAATVLKASELRQLTETGLPMLDLLSKKLTETQGKLVSAADVMDLISKRAISYEMVEEILYDLTDAGGMFYNMQVKQSQTLFGMWSKLGDAAAIMYDQIGNTSSINAGMKLAIRSIESMMRNWKTTARVLDSVAVAMAVYIVGLKNAAVASKALTSAVALENLAHQQQIIRTPKIIAGIIGINNAKKISTLLTGLHTKAVLSEAAATNVLTKGFWKLTAAMLANPWVAAASAIALVGVALFHFIGNTETAAERAEKLNNSVASLKNLDDTTKPLIDTYNELINKTERTAEEQKKLSEVTHELAKQYPGAITAIGNFGEEVDLAADKLNMLYQAEKQARMDNTRFELEQTEKKIKEVEAEIEKYQQQLASGEKTIYKRLGDSGLRTKKVVPLTEEDKGNILKRIDELRFGEDGQSGLFGLQQSAEAARRALGLLPSEAAQAVEKFGAWKKRLTEFNKEVGGVKVRLFDDSTINQFGTLEEALDAAAKKYKEAAESVEKYHETLKKGVAGLGQEQFDKISAERDEAQATKELSEEMLKFYNAFSLALKAMFGKGGRQSDPRLQNLKEEISLTKKLYDEYHKLEKQIGATKAAEKIQQIYSNTIKTLQDRAGKYGFTFELPFTDENLKSNMQHFIDKMKELQKLRDKKGKPLFPNIGKEIDEAVAQLEDVDLNSLQKTLEKKLKGLSDRISRTKTAKEFYEKILRLTRNEGLAFQATFSVYGKDTLDTFTDEVEQLKQNFGEIDITAAINLKTKQIDYKKLRDIWDADKSLPDNLRKIQQAYDSAIKSILDNGDKLSEKQLERWGKDLERAREYADKRIELAQYTATQIAEIEAKRDSLDPESKNYAAQVAMYNKMISGYREREKNEAAKLDYEQIKEQIGMFDDLGVRIGTAFESILTQLREYTKSPDFARLGLEAQKNVYQQIAKIEDRIAEGFQGIGVGTVSEYVRQYSTAASEYLTAQNNLRDATLRAIEADKEWERVKESNDEAAKTAAWAEKQLADSRVRTAAASVNTAGANLQATQERAARASAKFDNNLQKVEQSIRGLNNGALKALWDLLGDKGKRSVGEFLSGSYKMVSAINKLTEAVTESGSDMGALSKTIADNLANALQGIDPEDTEAIAKAATKSLKTTLSSVISDKGVVELLSNTLSKNIGEIASQALSGVLSTEDAANKVGALIDGIADAASKTGEMWGAIISLVLSLLDEFAENGIGTFLGELLDNIADAVEGILANLLTDSLPKIIGSVGNVVKGVGTGLADLLTFGAFDLTGAKRIKRANKEIERQQEILDRLEYTYSRLEKAADSLFGADYISNYNAQMKNLQAQQTAYLRMAEAERSKGKDADDAKIAEYTNAARDAADKIQDMRNELTSKFLGTDRASAAREFAESWLEAKATFASTTDAIQSKYKAMLKSMIVEGAAAKVIDNILAPMWDNMNAMLKKGNIQGAMDYLASNMDGFLQAADSGLNALWATLEARGYDMQKLLGETSDGPTGIAHDIATASEESINGLAAGINTQNFYIAQQLQEVQRIRAIVEAGLQGSGKPSDSSNLLLMQEQAMNHYAAIEANTAATVARLDSVVRMLEGVITPRGTKGARGIQVWT